MQPEGRTTGHANLDHRLCLFTHRGCLRFSTMSLQVHFTCTVGVEYLDDQYNDENLIF